MNSESEKKWGLGASALQFLGYAKKPGSLKVVNYGSSSTRVQIFLTYAYFNTS
jgi:hypothetical protein